MAGLANMVQGCSFAVVLIIIALLSNTLYLSANMFILIYWSLSHYLQHIYTRRAALEKAKRQNLSWPPPACPCYAHDYWELSDMQNMRSSRAWRLLPENAVQSSIVTIEKSSRSSSRLRSFPNEARCSKVSFLPSPTSVVYLKACMQKPNVYAANEQIHKAYLTCIAESCKGLVRYSWECKTRCLSMTMVGEHTIVIRTIDVTWLDLCWMSKNKITPFSVRLQEMAWDDNKKQADLL